MDINLKNADVENFYNFESQQENILINRVLCKFLKTSRNRATYRPEKCIVSAVMKQRQNDSYPFHYNACAIYLMSSIRWDEPKCYFFLKFHEKMYLFSSTCKSKAIFSLDFCVALIHCALSYQFEALQNIHLMKKSIIHRFLGQISCACSRFLATKPALSLIVLRSKNFKGKNWTTHWRSLHSK